MKQALREAEITFGVEHDFDDDFKDSKSLSSNFGCIASTDLGRASNDCVCCVAFQGADACKEDGPSMTGYQVGQNRKFQLIKSNIREWKRSS